MVCLCFNTSLPYRNDDSGWNNLERIRIPTFSGNKTEFQKWNATFTSCVDASAMSAQFKMLRWETIKGLGTCKVCGASHAVWNCYVFKSRSIQEKWATAKKLGHCYRCLGDDHLGGECPRSRVCNIDGCRDRHNRLLHCKKRHRQIQLHCELFQQS